MISNTNNTINVIYIFNLFILVSIALSLIIITWFWNLTGGVERVIKKSSLRCTH